MFCTHKAGAVTAPPMEPMITMLAADNPIYMLSSLPVFFAAIKAFFAGLVIPTSEISTHLIGKVFPTAVKAAVVLTSSDSYYLGQQAIPPFLLTGSGR